MSLYDTLGVPSDADQDAIKKAFRRKARIHHPDREGGDGAAMAEVNKAYAVLSVPEKRERYDKSGETGERPTIEAEATARFMQIILALLDEEGINVIITGRSKVRDAANSTAKARRVLVKQKDVLVRRRDKIRVKKGAVNLVHQIIGTQLAAIENDLKAITHADKVIELVGAMFDDYESDEVERPQNPTREMHYYNELLRQGMFK